jgi:hypothetical protein
MHSLPLTRADVVRSALIPDVAQGMRARTLLMALPPFIGPERADALLEKTGTPKHDTVRRLGPRQRERLLRLLA